MTQVRRFRARVQFAEALTEPQIDVLVEVFALAPSISGDRLTAEMWAVSGIDVLRLTANGLAEANWTVGLPPVKQVRIAALRDYLRG